MTIPAIRTNDCMLSKSIPTDHEMLVYTAMAKQAVTSKMYSGSMKDESSVMMIMLSARELGIPPMQALNGGINIIQGKVEISARMMSALIRRAGHRIEIKQSTDAGCTLIGKRTDTGESLGCSYYFAEAQKAGLIKQGGGWTKCPKDMCFARALSRLARQLFSDVIGIGYVEGEIRASTAELMLPDDIAIVDEIVHSDEELKSLYFEIFHPDDHALANDYLLEVQAHFQWPESQSIIELLKDKDRLARTFLVWKNKKLENK